MRIEPQDPNVLQWYESRDALQPGLLQWSPRYGGHETVTITPNGVDLLILVFENTDDSGRITYLEGTQRAQADSIHLVGKWRVTVEVAAADGSTAECTFGLSRGQRDPLSSLKIAASSQGTLYPPAVQILTEPRSRGT